MVICDRCPFLDFPDNPTYNPLCRITMRQIHPLKSHWRIHGISCPLLEIKLKDGTVFKPEVAGE
jgi:hypothetical protein